MTATHDINALFGELRSLLGRPRKHSGWVRELIDLAARARETNARRYDDQWVTHMAAASVDWPSPLLTVSGLHALERVETLLPFARVRLNASVKKLAPEDAPTLFASPSLRIVSELHLGDNGSMANHLDALLTAPHLTHLDALNLRMCHLDDSHIERLAESPILAGVTSLNLNSNTHITQVGTAHLAASPQLASLTKLLLSWIEFGPQGIAHLVESPHMAGLTALHLGKTRIGNDGARLIAQSPNMSSLEVLNVSMNDIHGDGVRAIAHSEHLTNLEDLRLGGRPGHHDTNIDDNDAFVLANAPGLSTLSKLVLFAHAMSHVGAQALATSPYLSERIRSRWRS